MKNKINCLQYIFFSLLYYCIHFALRHNVNFFLLICLLLYYILFYFFFKLIYIPSATSALFCISLYLYLSLSILYVCMFYSFFFLGFEQYLNRYTIHIWYANIALCVEVYSFEILHTT